MGLIYFCMKSSTNANFMRHVITISCNIDMLEKRISIRIVHKRFQDDHADIDNSDQFNSAYINIFYSNILNSVWHVRCFVYKISASSFYELFVHMITEICVLPFHLHVHVEMMAAKIENTRWVSCDIKNTKQGFENTCWIARLAKRFNMCSRSRVW